MATLPVNRLSWESATVDGRAVAYGVGGQGMPVVFLHGWGLGHHTYKASLGRVVQLGTRVYAPALPGFAAAPDLSGAASMRDYSQWLDRFLRTIGVSDPVILVGHSFGGGVAIQFAHDFPGRVRSLVLVNSVGGPVWSSSAASTQLLADRPVWDWGLHLSREVLSLSFPRMRRVFLAVWEDALSNAIRNPHGLWRSAQLARRADLTAELQVLRRRRLDITAVWADGDRVIPRASAEALARAAGITANIISGNHGWPLVDPAAFAAVMSTVIDDAADRALVVDLRAAEAPRPRRHNLSVSA